MKIALIGTTAACVYGFRADLIKALVAGGHEVYALALDYDEKSREKVQKLGAITVDYKFSRAGLNPFSDVANTLKLAKSLKQIKPDLVFSYFSKPVIFGTFAAVLAGVKRRIGMLEGLGYVFTDTPSGTGYKVRVLRQVQALLYRLSFPFLERIIFLNPDDPVDLIDKYRISVKKVDVLGAIGLNLQDYPYSPSVTKSPISFLFIGRLLAEKGVNEYVAAARLVKKRYPQTRFVMLGGLDEENPGGLSAATLKQLVEDGLVVHPGHVSNVVDWIIESDVFVLPSYYREGVPRSTQEAMAVGRAVITTDVPGCRETVVDGVNGFLVPRWSAQKLAEKMLFIIEHPECLEKMGQESYRIAQEKFNAQKVNERLLNLLDI
ncbi:glycosyltransferase family 4 protein [Pseudomonas chlororaphis]|uniref:glycosyltransferase family 4 protein n=1 Tax=Pseudomonas chlororaphis TaxID=587753 RepID=UPI00209AC685|nr:glycosyltransferase family 4 protein [Pseudomonas chlororaphis]MCO7570701.1 glycosyltransferase family 4 protein [Pseudomonas chlororaphis]MCO7588779.1 glycosyltransferase family 4 protein [Pseudomonas chlororaphis]MCO7611916.1 glycosyltransferase family 4 protein [Pseudomonas chlororaphis]